MDRMLIVMDKTKSLKKMTKMYCLFFIALLFFSGCQHSINSKNEEPKSPIVSVDVKKDIAKEFSSVIKCFLNAYFLCNKGSQNKIFLKPFGSNAHDIPYLDSYLYKICSDKIQSNDYIKFVSSLKSQPSYVIESYIVKNFNIQLLVNISNYPKRDIIYTRTIPFMINDIDSNDYHDHKTNAIKAKQFAFLILKSDIKSYSYDDTYTIKGPKIESSYTSNLRGSVNYEDKYKSDNVKENKLKKNNESTKGKTSVNANVSGSYIKQKSYTYDIGKSGLYPIDQQCIINGDLREANDDDIYYEDGIEANKKQFFVFSFVGGEWDALAQIQRKHKKYIMKCYIIPKTDETIIMTVKYVYQKDNKGIFVEAMNSQNQIVDVYYTNEM